MQNYANTHITNRIILGTAQLGMNYGIANTIGKPSDDDALNIIETAYKLGIKKFDTATAYGDSETRLGYAFKKLNIEDDVEVITKLGNDDIENEKTISETIHNCLQRLQIKSISTVLLHSIEALSQLNTASVLQFIKETNLVKLVGVSVYTADDAIKALQLAYVDVVQMPLNALDQQAVSEGVIDLAKRNNKKILFRSIYLQGLLLLPEEKIPAHMQFANSVLNDWRKLIRDTGVEPQVAAIKLAESLSGGMDFLIGCESVTQLKENVTALANQNLDLTFLLRESKVIASKTPDSIRNPSLWPKPLEKVS